MHHPDRREFLKSAAFGASAAIGAGSLLSALNLQAQSERSGSMKFGLVTYLWGKDMDLPELLDVCEKSGLSGVELRTDHAHGVEPSLSKSERTEVRKRFADSPVELVGYGSNAQYHESDPAKLKHNIELTKKYIHLMHDCGGTGVKVKPNQIPADVARDKTIQQIGRSLNEVAEYAQGYGQQIRVEVHGRGTSELPAVRDIFQVADHSNATVCWNSNDVDLQGGGLEHNFNLVKDRFGATVHVRELDDKKYPYADLMQLFLKMRYSGWILLEARTKPQDKIAALISQRKLFEKLTAPVNAP